jgi:hypothetical protein
MKFRDLLRKIDNAIRPPHVGPEQPTDVTERGGTANSSANYVSSQQDKRPS